MRSASLTGRSRRPPGSMRFVAVLVVLVALAGGVALDTRAEGGQTDARIVLFTSGCTKGSFVCTAFRRALLRTGMSGRAISPDLREDPVGTLSLLARQG